ncbi:MAG: peptidoglycan-binding domain-containing protein [Pseudomonadota bacterium]
MALVQLPRLALLLVLLVVAACGTRAPPPLEDLVSGRQEVVALQSALLARGFPPGGVDGVIGPRTREAITAYQRAYDLPVSGYVDAELKQSLLGRTGSLSSVSGSGLLDLRYLEPPYPRDLRGFLERRYGPSTASAWPHSGDSWLDVSQASLGAQPGSGEAVIVSRWSADDRQTSQLSIFRRAGGGFAEILGPLDNRGYEFADGISNGLRDIAVTDGSGYRLWRFDGEGYR